MKKAVAARSPEIRRRTPRPHRTNGEATRARILDTAEVLFAEHGYSAVSLRKITATAGVNVAAVHFHFASKEALFEALFNRRVDPINEGRLAGLQATLDHARDGRPMIEEVIAAFVRPYLGADKELDAGRIVLLQFIARATADQDRSIQGVLRKKFDPTWKALFKASRKALPDLSEESLNWGLFFLLGALYSVNPNRTWLANLSGGKCSAADTDAAFRYLLPFLAGGLRAMSALDKTSRQPAPRKPKRKIADLAM